jgi:peptidoglycan hydrolase-like protein with peptidoglycan-binding domain
MRGSITAGVAALVLCSPFIASAATLSDLQAHQALEARIAVLQGRTPPSTPSTTAFWPNLTRRLSRGSRGSDVSSLQTFFNSEYSNFTSDYITGYFGPKTEAALKRWRREHGVVSSGTPATTGYGAVGPKTRAAIADACSSALKSLPAPLSTPRNNETIPPPLFISTSTPIIGILGGGGGGGGSVPPPTATLTGNGLPVIVCSALSAFNKSSQDAQPTIKNCIDQTPSGGTLALPAGRYAIASQIKITKPLTLKTNALTSSDAPCSSVSPSACAEIYAFPTFHDDGMLYIDQNGTSVDHIVIDGNRAARTGSAAAADCVSGKPWMGGNIHWNANNSSLSNSVVKNALCGTGLGVEVSTNVSIISNTITSNGDHSQTMMWSDGLTLLDLSNSVIKNNQISDSTDVDIIFGGCQNCTISGNTITHGVGYAQSSFAALMLHAWPTTSGNYTGTAVTGNSIDCGASFGCGFGLTIGAHAWYDTAAYGGTVFNNTIRHAQQGINVDSGDTKPVHDFTIYNNTVTSTAYFTHTKDGLKRTSAYNLEPGNGASSIDRSLDTTTTYTSDSWVGDIPNYNGELKPAENVCGLLPSSALLTPGQSITSCNGTYTLVFQGDGNVVLYKGAVAIANALWSTGTYGKSAGTFIMQGDGNLVLYKPGQPVAENALWASYWNGGIFGKPGKLAVQDDGNLVIYATGDNSVLWASGTNTAKATP